MAVEELELELVGASQVARRLGLSVTRVLQLADAGQIPATRTGIGRVFDQRDVDQFARERQQRTSRRETGE